MKNSRIIWGIMSLFVLVTIAVTTGTRDSHSQQKVQPTPVERSNRDQHTFPAIEHSNDYQSKSQKQRSEKYDKGIGVLSLDPDIPKDLEAVLAVDPAKDLPALPVDESEIVVLGKVLGASARLSGNKRSVYSDFKIEIEKVFKNKDRREFEKGKYLIVEREGGIVQYPSGHKFWYRIPGQQMPVGGHRYILFLTSDFPIYGYQKKDLYLLAGYELRDGRVFPLDNSTDSSPVSSPYMGKDESVLFDDLNNAINNQ